MENNYELRMKAFEAVLKSELKGIITDVETLETYIKEMVDLVFEPEKYKAFTGNLKTLQIQSVSSRSIDDFILYDWRKDLECAGCLVAMITAAALLISAFVVWAGATADVSVPAIVLKFSVPEGVAQLLIGGASAAAIAHELCPRCK